MTVRKRKRHAPEFKAQVALEAYRGDKTINQLATDMAWHCSRPD